MREIKYRTWNGNYMEYNPKLTGHYDVVDLNEALNDTTDIFMQYTGLKDKNGKDIYEGDIFDCPYSDETDNHHKWQIIWGEVTGGFVLQRIGIPCNQRQVHQTVSDMTRRQILGNVHENPNLIK